MLPVARSSISSNARSKRLRPYVISPVSPRQQVHCSIRLRAVVIRAPNAGTSPSDQSRASFEALSAAR